MSMDWQVVPIDFGQGIDTKTDQKMVVMGKFILLRDCVFTNPKSIKKRNGFTVFSSSILGGGNITTPRLVKDFNNELIVWDSTLAGLYSYSSTDSAWVYKGYYNPCKVSASRVGSDLGGLDRGDSAVLGNLALYVSGAGEYPFYRVVDLTTGASVSASSLSQDMYTVNDAGGGSLQVGSTCVRAFVLGTSQLALSYINSSNNLVMRIFSADGSTLGNAINIYTTVGKLSAVGYSGAIASYDVITRSTGPNPGAVFAVCAANTSMGTPNKIGIEIVDINGGVVYNNFISDSTTTQPCPVSLGYDSTNDEYYLIYADAAASWAGTVAGTCSVYYWVFSATLSTVLSRTTIFTANTGAVVSINPVRVSSTTQKIYIGKADNTLTGVSYPAPYIPYTTVRTATRTGTVANLGNMMGVISISNAAVTNNGQTVMAFAYPGLCNDTSTSSINHIQPSIFLIDILNSTSSTPQVVAKVVDSVAYYNMLSYDVGYRTSLNSFSNSLIINFPIITSLTAGSVSGTSSAGSLASQVTTIDFGNADLGMSVNSGSLLCLNGGFVTVYDGSFASELNFDLFPEICFSSTTGGGSIGAGTYVYYATFQWTDSNGNLHESSPSNVTHYSTITTGASATVTLKISLPYLTQKVRALTLTDSSKVYLCLYRTTNGGTTPFLVNQPLYFSELNTLIQNGFISITDTLADASIINNPELYTTGGVFENGAPPPTLYLVSHNARLWGARTLDNTIWYSKTFENGVGLSPSPFLTQQIDTKLGNITGLAEMDEKIVIFKQRGLCFMSGDGASDTGASSSLTNPQFVPSDVGCDQAKSIITMPMGVMFHSPKGIYLLDRALNVSYIGAAVELFNNLTISSAVLMNSKNQVRFTTTSGSTTGSHILYDYFMQQWSVLTFPPSYGATIWQGNYVSAGSALLYLEDTSLYTDNGTSYQMNGTMAPINLAGIQGFQRVRRLIVIGDYANGSSAAHAFRITAFYNSNTSLGSIITYTFGSASSSGVFQYRERLGIQKCDSLNLIITEITNSSGVAQEYIDISNISLEVGIKKGVNKVGTTTSLG